MKTPTIIITISGGVASVLKKPKGITLHIIDFDGTKTIETYEENNIIIEYEEQKS